jgi:hypothetical protein
LTDGDWAKGMNGFEIVEVKIMNNLGKFWLEM